MAYRFDEATQQWVDDAPQSEGLSVAGSNQTHPSPKAGMFDTPSEYQPAQIPEFAQPQPIEAPVTPPVAVAPEKPVDFWQTVKDQAWVGLTEAATPLKLAKDFIRNPAKERLKYGATGDATLDYIQNRETPDAAFSRYKEGLIAKGYDLEDLMRGSSKDAATGWFKDAFRDNGDGIGPEDERWHEQAKAMYAYDKQRAGMQFKQPGQAVLPPDQQTKTERYARAVGNLPGQIMYMANYFTAPTLISYGVGEVIDRASNRMGGEGQINEAGQYIPYDYTRKTGEAYTRAVVDVAREIAIEKYLGKGAEKLLKPVGEMVGRSAVGPLAKLIASKTADARKFMSDRGLQSFGGELFEELADAVSSAFVNVQPQRDETTGQLLTAPQRLVASVGSFFDTLPETIITLSGMQLVGAGVGYAGSGQQRAQRRQLKEKYGLTNDEIDEIFAAPDDAQRVVTANGIISKKSGIKATPESNVIADEVAADMAARAELEASARDALALDPSITAQQKRYHAEQGIKDAKLGAAVESDEIATADNFAKLDAALAIIADPSSTPDQRLEAKNTYNQMAAKGHAVRVSAFNRVKSDWESNTLALSDARRSGNTEAATKIEAERKDMQKTMEDLVGPTETRAYISSTVQPEAITPQDKLADMAAQIETVAAAAVRPAQASPDPTFVPPVSAAIPSAAVVPPKANKADLIKMREAAKKQAAVPPQIARTPQALAQRPQTEAEFTAAFNARRAEGASMPELIKLRTQGNARGLSLPPFNKMLSAADKQIKEAKRAVQVRRPAQEVPRIDVGGQDQSQGGEGIRQGQQGDESTGARQGQAAQPVAVPQAFNVAPQPIPAPSPVVPAKMQQVVSKATRKGNVAAALAKARQKAKQAKLQAEMTRKPVPVPAPSPAIPKAMEQVKVSAPMTQAKKGVETAAKIEKADKEEAKQETGGKGWKRFLRFPRRAEIERQKQIEARRLAKNVNIGFGRLPVASMIYELGGLQRKSDALKAVKASGRRLEGEWNGSEDANYPPFNAKLYSAAGMTPDVMADRLYEKGLLSSSSPSEMWAKLTLEKAKHKSGKLAEKGVNEDTGEMVNPEADNADRFYAQVESKTNKYGENKTLVDATKLNVGDVITVVKVRKEKGKPVIETITVKDIDPDSGVLTVRTDSYGETVMMADAKFYAKKIEKAVVKSDTEEFDVAEEQAKPSEEVKLHWGDTARDNDGNLWWVHSSRYGLVTAHPVVNGKPVVNNQSAERFAVTRLAQQRYPEARTDLIDEPIRNQGTDFIDENGEARFEALAANQQSRTNEKYNDGNRGSAEWQKVRVSVEEDARRKLEAEFAGIVLQGDQVAGAEASGVDYVSLDTEFLASAGMEALHARAASVGFTAIPIKTNLFHGMSDPETKTVYVRTNDLGDVNRVAGHELFHAELFNNYKAAVALHKAVNRKSAAFVMLKNRLYAIPGKRQELANQARSEGVSVDDIIAEELAAKIAGGEGEYESGATKDAVSVYKARPIKKGARYEALSPSGRGKRDAKREEVKSAFKAEGRLIGEVAKQRMDAIKEGIELGSAEKWTAAMGLLKQEAGKLGDTKMNVAASQVQQRQFMALLYRITDAAGKKSAKMTSDKYREMWEVIDKAIPRSVQAYDRNGVARTTPSGKPVRRTWANVEKYRLQAATALLKLKGDINNEKKQQDFLLTVKRVADEAARFDQISLIQGMLKKAEKSKQIEAGMLLEIRKKFGDLVYKIKMRGKGDTLEELKQMTSVELEKRIEDLKLAAVPGKMNVPEIAKAKAQLAKVKAVEALGKDYSYETVAARIAELEKYSKANKAQIAFLKDLNRTEKFLSEGARNLADLSVAELSKMAYDLEGMILEGKNILALNKAARDEYIAEIGGIISANPFARKLLGMKPVQGIKESEADFKTRMEAWRKSAKFDLAKIMESYAMNYFPIDAVIDELDGRNGYMGPMSTHIRGMLENKENGYYAERNEFEVAAKKEIDPLKLTPMEKAEISVYAILKQVGGAIEVQKNIDAGYITQDQFDEMQARWDANGGKLPPRLQQTYDYVIKINTETGDRLAEAMRKAYNINMDRVDAYTHWQKNMGGQVNDVDGVPMMELANGYYMNKAGTRVQRFTGTDTKITIAREGGGGVVNLDFTGMFVKAHNQALRIIHMAEAVKLAQDIVQSQPVVDTIGQEGSNLMTRWLSTVATNGADTERLINPFMKRRMRNLGSFVLAFKLTSMLKQLGQLVTGAGAIGASNVSKGMAAYLNPAKREWAEKNFPQVTARSGNDMAFDQFRTKIFGQRSFTEWGFLPMQKLDQMAAMAVAIGSYEQWNAQNNKGKPVDYSKPADSRGVLQAQRDVRRTSASSFSKDAPMFLSRGFSNDAWGVTLSKLVHQFQTFPISTGGTLIHEMQSVLGRSANKKDWVGLTRMLAGALASVGFARGIDFGNANMMNAIIEMMGGEPPDKEEEFLAWQDWVRSFVLMVPGAALLANKLSSRGDRTGLPVYDAVSSGASAIKEVVSDIQNEEPDQAALNAALAGTSLAGIFTGYPVGGSTIVQFFDKMFDEDRQ